MKRIQLPKKLQIDTICTAFVETYAPQFSFPGESHDFWELDYILDGDVGITSGADIYSCSANDLIIHRAGVFHSVWTTDQPATILTVSFSGHQIEQYVPWGKFEASSTEQTILQLIRELISNRLNNRVNCLLESCRWPSFQALTNLMETLFLLLNDRRENRTFPELNRAAVLFSEVAEYMQANVENALCVETICANCGIGRTALKELFHQYTGIGVMHYYNQLRCRYAMMLICSGKSMREIAEQMHFSSPSYFSCFFQRNTGQTPLHYRQQLLQQQSCSSAE